MSIVGKSWTAVAVAALGALGLVLWMGVPVFPLDDAYIVQHSVQGLLAGAETRYAGAQPLTGATSPLHVFLVAFVSLAMPVAWAQLLMAAAASVLYVAGAFHLALRAGASTVYAAGVAVVAVLIGHSLHQMMNGLETGLAMAAVIWTLVWFFEPRPASPWQYALLGVLPWIRPELAMLSGLVGLRALWATWQEQRFAAAPAVVRMGLWTLVGAAPIAAYLLLNGYPLLANTISAKAAFFAEGCAPASYKALTVARVTREFVVLCGLGLLGLPLLMLTRFRWIGLAFVLAMLIAFFLRLPGALGHNYYRYLHVLLPLAVAGWAMLPMVEGPWVARGRVWGLGVAVALAIISFPASWLKYAGALNHTQQNLAPVANWVNAHVPADATIMIHDAGYISTVGRQPLVDLVGLKTPSSAAVHEQTTLATCSRDPRAIDQIARQNGVRYMVLLNGWDRIFRMSDSLREKGWSVVALYEGGTYGYNVYAISHPDQQRPEERMFAAR